MIKLARRVGSVVLTIGDSSDCGTGAGVVGGVVVVVGGVVVVVGGVFVGAGGLVGGVVDGGVAPVIGVRVILGGLSGVVALSGIMNPLIEPSAYLSSEAVIV